MTKLYENMKTEKRQVKVGDTVRLKDLPAPFGNNIYTVEEVGKFWIKLEGETLRVGHGDYEVVTEPDAGTGDDLEKQPGNSKFAHKDLHDLYGESQNENSELRTELRKSKDLVEALREDHAASEDYYQQEIKRLNGIIDTIQNYVKGLEGGVR